MDQITINAAIDLVIPIPESASGNTVTYEIISSAGSVLASGSATFVRDEMWRVSYTPTALGVIILKVNNTTIDSKRENIYRVVGDVPTPSESTDFSYDISTNLGKVRALIGDITAASYVLSDSQITAFLAMHSNDLFMTAHQSMIAIASSRALLAKKKSAGNYSEDLSAIAKECREAAKMFKESAMQDPAEAVAESFYTDFAYNYILTAKALRGETD